MGVECHDHIGNFGNSAPKASYPSIKNFAYPKLDELSYFFVPAGDIVVSTLPESKLPKLKHEQLSASR